MAEVLVKVHRRTPLYQLPFSLDHHLSVFALAAYWFGYLGFRYSLADLLMRVPACSALSYDKALCWITECEERGFIGYEKVSAWCLLVRYLPRDTHDVEKQSFFQY